LPDLKEELHRKLQASRAGLLSKLDNLGEYDRRRPTTPTGTNLLGLVKHLAGLEYTYLGESFGYPAPESMPWFQDGSIWQGADMWATPDESSEYITGLYRRACAHADGVIAALDLEAPGSVTHWPEDRRDTTLGVLLIRMVAETAQHAGHADIIRELIDGKGGPDQDDIDEAAASSMGTAWSATLPHRTIFNEFENAALLNSASTGRQGRNRGMTAPANSSSVSVLARSWVKNTKEENPASASSAIFASSAGWRKLLRSTSCPTRNRDVRASNAVASVHASSEGLSGCPGE
jgi:hypothetical protein